MSTTNEGKQTFTAYGKEVKKALIEIDQTQDWLMERVKEHTGLFIDSSYLYKILTGQRAAPKIVQAINEILLIGDEGE